MKNKIIISVLLLLISFCGFTQQHNSIKYSQVLINNNSINQSKANLIINLNLFNTGEFYINELAKPDIASLPYGEKLKALDASLGKKYDKNPTDLEKVFLEEYKLFGISLYKSDNLELNNWKKLELKTDGTVGQVPCNN